MSSFLMTWKSCGAALMRAWITSGRAFRCTSRVPGHLYFVLPGLVYLNAGVVVERAVDFFFDVKAAQQDVVVAVQQADVVDHLQALEALFEDGQQVDHGLLGLGVQVIAVGDGKVIVEVKIEAPFAAPIHEAIDQGGDAGVLTAYGN